MGFFGAKTSGRGNAMPHLDLMHKLGCRVCPLDKADAYHPKLDPTGSADPLVYILGGATDRLEDREAEHFTGSDGSLLRSYMDPAVWEQARFNNVVRTLPPDSESPPPVAIECCRGSVENDITRTKPAAIFGFGNLALQWVRPGTRLVDMRGRKFPVLIGQHAVWFYCFEHPRKLNMLRASRFNRPMLGTPASADETAFKFDMQRACADVVDMTRWPNTPVTVTRAQAEHGVEALTRTNGGVSLILQRLKEAAAEPRNGFDYETDRLRPYDADAKILTVGIATPSRAFAFPLFHREAGWSAHELDTLLKGFQDYLASATRKAVHHLAFEMEWTAVMFGDETIRADNWDDTTTQAFVLDERMGDKNKTKSGPASLDFLCRLHFNAPIKDWSNLDRKNMAAEPLAKILPYNAIDSRFHLKVCTAQHELLEQQGLLAAYMMRLTIVPSVVLTQMRGIEVDIAENEQQFIDLTQQSDAAQQAVLKLDAAQEYRRRFRQNLRTSSDGDILKLMKEVLNVSEPARGRLSADEATLKKLKDPIGAAILVAKKIDKRLSTYVLPMRPDSEHVYVEGDSHVLHGIFNTNNTNTGRFSGEDPNLQNFPIRTEDGRKLRRQLHARLGHRFLSIDYGQIEYRTIAMITKDPSVVKALWERYDVHMEWAERVAYACPARIGGKANLKDKKVMKEFRGDIKNQWTFPLFFGAKLKSVAGWLEIDEDILSPLYDEFWSTFSGVLTWQKELTKVYDEQGWVPYLTGRRRHAPISPNQLFNAPVQGSTADLVANAMVRLTAYNDPYMQPLLQIHDDLHFEFPEYDMDSYAEKAIRELLHMPFDFINVPITLEGKMGDSWGSMLPFGDFSSDDPVWARV